MFEKYCFLEPFLLSRMVFVLPSPTRWKGGFYMCTEECLQDQEAEWRNYPHSVDSVASRDLFSLIYWNCLNKSSSGEQEPITLMWERSKNRFMSGKTSSGPGDASRGDHDQIVVTGWHTLWHLLSLLSTLSLWEKMLSEFLELVSHLICSSLTASLSLN